MEDGREEAKAMTPTSPNNADDIARGGRETGAGPYRVVLFDGSPKHWEVYGPPTEQFPDGYVNDSETLSEEAANWNCDNLNAAVLAERKACAEVARTTPFRKGEWLKANDIIADKILSRGGATDGR